MPTYQYQCNCGNTFELDFPMSNIKQKVKCVCGKMAQKVFTRPNALIKRRYIDVAKDRMRDYDPRANRGRGY